MILVLLGAGILNAQAPNCTWPLTTNGSPTISDTYFLNGSDLVVGSGVNQRGYGSNGVDTRGWNSANLDANDYYEYTITAKTDIIIDSFSFTHLTGTAHTGTAAVYYSINGGTETQLGTNIAVGQASVTTTISGINVLLGDEDVFRIRVYGWAFQNAQTNFYNNNAIIAIKESSTTDLYRSTNTGDWDYYQNWQSSPDGGVTWLSATTYPTADAASIYLQDGYTITLPDDIDFTEVTYEGGTLALENKDFAISSDDAVLSDLSVTMTDDVNNWGGDSSIARTWQTYGTFDTDVDLQLTYPESETEESSVKLWYRVGDTGSWFYYGTYTTTDNGDTRTITVTGVTDLGSSGAPIQWTISDMDQTLPVELSSFTGIITPQNFIMLEWITQSETNVSGFYLFRNNADNLSDAERINAFIQATNTSQEASYIFVDSEAIPGYTYYYWLQHIDLSGEFEFHGPVSIHLSNTNTVMPAIPLVTSLQSIYPNPFNPTATISYGLSKAAGVELVILNLKGQMVRRLVSEAKNAGSYRVMWDGRNDNGVAAATGVYLVRMRAGSYKETRKLIMLK